MPGLQSNPGCFFYCDQGVKELNRIVLAPAQAKRARALRSGCRLTEVEFARLCQLFTNLRNTRFTSFSSGSLTMPSVRRLSALASALLCAVLASTAAAAEGDPISVKVNMARILRINAPAATVIIGNPGVADVTIQ